MNRIDVANYEGPPQTAPDPGSDSGLSLRDIFQIVWGARLGLLICAFLGAAIAYGTAKQITPQYRSAASIMLDVRQQNVIDLESVLTDIPLTRQILESELLIIESDTLLERVVNKLRLDRDPEYNSSLAQPSEMKLMINERIAFLKTAVGLGGVAEGDTAEPPVPVNPEVAALNTRQRAIRALRGKLKARQLSPAYAISVQVTSSSPVKAALIANTVADQYVVDQLEAKYDAARRASTWLTSRLEELRARLEASEKAVQDYTAQYQTGDSQGASITTQQINQVNTQLTAARADLAAAEAKFRQAAQMVRIQGPAGAASSLTSPLLISLRGQRAELVRREAELSNRYGPKHPTMIELRTKVRDVDGAIAGEVRQIVTSLENEVQEADARVRSLSNSLSGLEVQAGGQAEAAVGLRQLEAEAEANRRIYNDFLQRLNETREQQGFQTADSRIIEPASPSWAPFVPRTKVSAALGGVAGGAFGLGILALIRLFASSFRTISSVTEKTGLPVLASIPKVSRRHMNKVLRYLDQRPNSDLAESARYLRNSLLVDAGGKLRSALVTSSFPDEGKSTLCILLAEMLGRMGKSVVLVDCDLRRPSLAKALSVRPEQDLVTLLNQEAALEEVVCTPAHGHFHLIPIKQGQGRRADLLASDRFSAFLEQLQKTYDFVLIDAPPVLGVSDFSVIGKQVDTTIIVLQWNKTLIASFQRTLRWLRDNRIEILGAVLSKVDRRLEAKYDTATYGAEYASFRRYYTN